MSSKGPSGRPAYHLVRAGLPKPWGRGGGEWLLPGNSPPPLAKEQLLQLEGLLPSSPWRGLEAPLLLIGGAAKQLDGPREEGSRPGAAKEAFGGGCLRNGASPPLLSSVLREARDEKTLAQKEGNAPGTGARRPPERLRPSLDHASQKPKREGKVSVSPPIGFSVWSTDGRPARLQLAGPTIR